MFLDGLQPNGLIFGRHPRNPRLVRTTTLGGPDIYERTWAIANAIEAGPCARVLCWLENDGISISVA